MSLKPVLKAAVNGLFLKWLGEEGTIDYLIDNLHSIADGQFIAKTSTTPKLSHIQRIPPSRNKVFRVFYMVFYNFYWYTFSLHIL